MKETDVGNEIISRREMLAGAAGVALVSALAAPWAWCAPYAHPTLAEVIASRFSYSEGIAPLDRAAMASWWPGRR